MPLLEAVPEELEAVDPDEAVEPEELEGPEPDELLLLPTDVDPPEELDRLDDEVPEAALVLSTEPPPQPLRLRHAAATAAVSSGENW